MSRKILIIILLVLAVTALLSIVNYTVNRSGLVSPRLTEVVEKADTQSTPQSSSTPYIPPNNLPKSIEYGSSTDLQQELDFVNPQVLDSDFE